MIVYTKCIEEKKTNIKIRGKQNRKLLFDERIYQKIFASVGSTLAEYSGLSPCCPVISDVPAFRIR